ncbi:MAG: cobalamin-dependent protein [Pseudomonadota bacterium]
MDNEIFPAGALLMELLIDLRENEALDEVRRLLREGLDPLKILYCSQEGIRRVGERYQQGRYFISGLIMAGEIQRQVVDLILPRISERIRESHSGRILVGTVRGDIHDIGKNLVCMLLRCHGFEVLDLGVDAPPEEFLAQALEFKPRVVGLSALLTTSHEAILDTVRLLKADPEIMARDVRIIIGGGFIDEKVCRLVGADHWAADAMTGVRYCRDVAAKK